MELKALADGLGVADVVDAMMMTHAHRAHIIDLVSPDPSRVLIGTAVTVGFLPVRKDFMDSDKHSLVPAIYRAVKDTDPKGTVLVLASNGHSKTSLGGGTKTSRVENLGMAGILADGYIRDFDEVRSYDFATYCMGEAVRAGGNEVQPYLTNVPVSFAGVTVVPGDVIFAKGSAAVVIPSGEAEAILKKARMIMEKMDKAKEAGRSEDPKAILAQGDSAI